MVLKQQKLFVVILVLILIFIIPTYTTAASTAEKSISANGLIEYPINTSPPQPSSPYFGWSAYPRTLSGTYSTQVIDQIIQTMNDNGLNIYRMAFNDFRDIDTVVIPYVQYFIDHCDYDIIIQELF
ncbi:MAG: hypothetical protein P8Y18_09100 [Candidatus Bathyarchaeota archaeon]